MTKPICILNARFVRLIFASTTFFAIISLILLSLNISIVKLEYKWYPWKHHGKFVTFITSNFTEQNGTLHLTGYFDDEFFSAISLLDVKNMSFLSGYHKTKTRRLERIDKILKWQREQNFTILEETIEKIPGKDQTKKHAKEKSKLIACPSVNSYSKQIQNPLRQIRNFPDWKLFEQNRNVPEVNCRLLFNNDTKEHNRTDKLMRRPFAEIPPKLFLNKTKNCEKYIKETGYITSSLTDEEESFPIAYSILVFKGIQQVETLLRSIYRPQNVYCIHCDKKADKDFIKAIHSIAGCFENVFISSRSFSVVWGSIGVLLPEMACMRDLWKHKTWKFFINLTGQEFPLRTNFELVKILRSYKGANDIESTLKRANKERWKSIQRPPHKIRPVKGSVHIAASRGYVEFVLFNKIARDFFNWTRGVQIPDESFFSTLNHNPHLHVPGSYNGLPETDCEIKPFLTRFKNWGNHIYNWPCHGTRVRLICVFGIGDLPLLESRQELFANKFYLHYQPYAYKCMDELIFNRTRDEYFNELQFSPSWYESLDFIKNTV